MHRERPALLVDELALHWVCERLLDEVVDEVEPRLHGQHLARRSGPDEGRRGKGEGLPLQVYGLEVKGTPPTRTGGFERFGWQRRESDPNSSSQSRARIWLGPKNLRAKVELGSASKRTCSIYGNQ